MRGGSDGLAPGPSDPSGRSAGPWRDLRRRAISAAVLAPIALGCVWAGGVAFAALVGVAAVVAEFEWLRLCRPWRAVGLPLGGALWIALAGAGLVWLRADPAVGRANLLFVLLIVWGSDIGAYLVGRWLGGPKLAPLISPGKTWSGTLGGIVAAVLVALAAQGWIPGRGGIVWGIGVAAGLCVIGQAGDLAESWAKRRAGVKDSGALIPGHGGVLDRLDALLAVAPCAALLALALGRGVLLWK